MLEVLVAGVANDDDVMEFAAVGGVLVLVGVAGAGEDRAAGVVEDLKYFRMVP